MARFTWGDALALALLAALMLSLLFWVPLYRALWILAGVLRYGLGWLVLIAGIAGLCFAVADQRRGRLLRHSLVVPCIVLAGWLFSGFLAPLGIWASAQWAVANHAGAFRPREPRLAPIHMLIEGVPDGGTAIVRTERGDPQRWDAGLGNRTVGGAIRRCWRLRAHYWVCDFG